MYFEQVFNEVARTTYDAAQRQKGCRYPEKWWADGACRLPRRQRLRRGSANGGASRTGNEAADAAGVRNLLTAEEQPHGKSYTIEERQKRVAELEQTLARIGTSTDPLRQEARRMIGQGNVEGGRANLDAALDADEKALNEAERVATERRKAAARSARDLAVLARGTDVVKAVTYYQRATRLDPSDAQTWHDYAFAALTAGRTAEARTAFEQAALKAQDPGIVYWAMLGLVKVATAQGSLPEVLRPALSGSGRHCGADRQG